MDILLGLKEMKGMAKGNMMYKIVLFVPDTAKMVYNMTNCRWI